MQMHTAPFDGVVTSTGYSYCTGGSLTNSNAWNAPTEPGDGGLTNSGILQKYEGHITSNSQEFYAQAFAYADWAHSQMGNTSNLTHPTDDGVFFNDYNVCTFLWATDLAAGLTTGGPPTDTVPAYCTATSPWIYTPYGKTTH